MLRKRLLSFALAGILLFSSSATALASNNSGNEVLQQQVSQDFTTPDPQSRYSAQGVKTKVIKEIIEFIIKHGDDAAKIIKRVSGKKISKKFLKYHSKIATGLTPLLDWVDVPKQAVYDAVFNALRSADVSRDVAASIALAIKEGLSWFIF